MSNQRYENSSGFRADVVRGFMVAYLSVIPTIGALVYSYNNIEIQSLGLPDLNRSLKFVSST